MTSVASTRPGSPLAVDARGFGLDAALFLQAREQQDQRVEGGAGEARTQRSVRRRFDGGQRIGEPAFARHAVDRDRERLVRTGRTASPATAA